MVCSGMVPSENDCSQDYINASVPYLVISFLKSNEMG